MNKMTPGDIGYFKKLFCEILENDKKAIEFEELLEKHSKGDSADQTMLDSDRRMLLRLKRRDDLYVKKVRQALDRISNKTFGECDACGGDIELSRLKARPTASLCISCKEKEESEEQKILYIKRSHTLGKQLINSSLENALKNALE